MPRRQKESARLVLPTPPPTAKPCNSASSSHSLVFLDDTRVLRGNPSVNGAGAGSGADAIC